VCAPPSTGELRAGLSPCEVKELSVGFASKAVRRKSKSRMMEVVLFVVRSAVPRSSGFDSFLEDFYYCLYFWRHDITSASQPYISVGP
jgi:hypothetical protein